MPRRYRLGHRATRMQATRERILDAAIALYTELGISGTTMRQVQERADVAPGTLRNHFSSRGDLDRALVEKLTAEAELPELSIIDGTRSLEERITTYLRVTGAFLERAQWIYRMWLREPMLTPVWNEAGATFGQRWDALMRRALGPLADDDDALTMLRAVSEPAFFQAIRARRGSIDDAADLVAAILVPWLAGRPGVGPGTTGRDDGPDRRARPRAGS